MASWYTEQLKDMRWQQKRLQALEAADWKCSKCPSVKELKVHHTFYAPGRAPWEYDLEDLLVLCDPCHRKEHNLPMAAREVARLARRKTIAEVEAQLAARSLVIQQQRDGTIPRTPIEDEIESVQVQIPLAEKSGDKAWLNELMARAIDLNRRRLGMVA